MRAAMAQLNLSARAYHRILKLARTIADLAGSEDIQSTHLADDRIQPERIVAVRVEFILRRIYYPGLRLPHIIFLLH